MKGSKVSALLQPGFFRILRLSMSKIPHWLKGGLLGIAVIGAFLLWMFKVPLPMMYGDSGDMLLFFAPAIFIAALGLGMRGTPASALETVLTLAIAFSVTAITYFIPGAIVGWLVGISPWRKHFTGVVIGVLLVLCVLALLLLILSSRAAYYER